MTRGVTNCWPTPPPCSMDASVYAFRVRPGDDASCGNLYKAQQPRVLGVPPSFREHFDEARRSRFSSLPPRQPNNGSEQAQPVARAASLTDTATVTRSRS